MTAVNSLVLLPLLALWAIWVAHRIATSPTWAEVEGGGE